MDTKGKYHRGPYDIVNVSGGVDSTACYLLRLEQGNDFRAVFADTGNEHENTLDYVRALSAKTGGPVVQIVKTDYRQLIAIRRMKLERMIETGNYAEGWDNQNAARVLAHLQPTGIPFLDSCVHAGRFPSPKARFCTGELKLSPIRKQMILPTICEAIQAGHPASSVVSWVGIRHDESPARADAEEWDYESMGNRVYRPLVTWTKRQCFGLLARWGIEPNPLYSQGCKRVGCIPCIMSAKDEVLTIYKRWPHHIDRLREWEHLVSLCSKTGLSTFFQSDKVSGKSHMGAHIDAVVDWSMTRRGGKQYDLFKQTEEPPACVSMYGLCD